MKGTNSETLKREDSVSSSERYQCPSHQLRNALTCCVQCHTGKGSTPKPDGGGGATEESVMIVFLGTRTDGNNFEP